MNDNTNDNKVSEPTRREQIQVGPRYVDLYFV